MVKVGFTGTRAGMTSVQRDVVYTTLLRLALEPEPLEFHHGDCVGADKEAQEIARDLGYKIHRHPPPSAVCRAFTPYDVDYEPKPYLERNRNIVRLTNYLIACPKDNSLKGGTWYTYRHAKEQGSYKRAMLIWPDGYQEFDKHKWPIM